MESSLVDIRALTERFEELARDIADAWEESVQSVQGTPPEQLAATMQKLQDLLIMAGKHPEMPALAEKEMRALNGHAFVLCQNLAEQASALGLDDQEAELRALPWSFSIWIVRHGGEITQLEPLVEALSAAANRLQKPEDLAHLYVQVDEILNALCPAIEDQVEQGTPPQAWRYLLINHAIIATRSFQPTLMRKAFDAILENIPDDAPLFFEEGMREMDRVGYPAHVRKVIVSYFQKFGTGLTLH